MWKVLLITVLYLINDVDGYINSDYGDDVDHWRSNFCYIFTLYADVISCKASLQSLGDLSTTKAEYAAATKGVKFVIVMRYSYWDWYCTRYYGCIFWWPECN